MLTAKIDLSFFDKSWWTVALLERHVRCIQRVRKCFKCFTSWIELSHCPLQRQASHQLIVCEVLNRAGKFSNKLFKSWRLESEGFSSTVPWSTALGYSKSLEECNLRFNLSLLTPATVPGQQYFVVKPVINALKFANREVGHFLKGCRSLHS